MASRGNDDRQTVRMQRKFDRDLSFHDVQKSHRKQNYKIQDERLTEESSFCR